MPEFKKGDRVRLVDDSNLIWSGMQVGDEATVVSDTRSDDPVLVYVEWNAPRGRAKRGIYFASRFELASGTVPPIVGRRYRTRCGEIVGPMRKPCPSRWTHGVAAVFDEWAWYAAGNYWTDEEHDLDLVEELPAEEPSHDNGCGASWTDTARTIVADGEVVKSPYDESGPVRTVATTRREIVPGSYGRLRTVDVGSLGISGRVTPVHVERRFYGAADLREIARILTQVADALEPQQETAA
ncbi:MAG: hypothetical protein KDJ36_07065 [Hyphomicrobiaceae bacterium]|nr:hypothetical protein [Hyphomicrobiaceae bacterium]